MSAPTLNGTQPANAAQQYVWNDVTGAWEAVQSGAGTLPTGGATAAKQDTGNTSLASILAKIIAAPATELTAAAILAKLIAAPATAANQATLIAAIGAAGDAIGANTVIGQLKQIALNTTPA